MLINLGFIVDYNIQTGQGKLDQTFGFGDGPGMFVLFGMENIRNQDLAARLKIGIYRGTRVFYTYMMIRDKAQALDIWLTGNEIPTAIHEQFVIRLEKKFCDTAHAKFFWLDDVTKTFGGVELYQRLSLESSQAQSAGELVNKLKINEELEKNRQIQLASATLKENQRLEWRQKIEEEVKKVLEDARFGSKADSAERALAAKNAQEAYLYELEMRKDEIREFCTARGITHLIHFTRFQNLNKILRVGLYSRSHLEQLPVNEIPQFNDQERWDNCKEAICLSIGYPNYKMFNVHSQSDRSMWVVLELNPAILWELDCAFCRENASSRKVRNISLSERKQSSALFQMFGEYPESDRQKLHLPDDYPTHPQAEVLVFETIRPKYIQSVHFFDAAKLQYWQEHHPLIRQPEMQANRYYFNPRSDYQFWQPSVSVQNTVQQDVPEPEIPFDVSDFDHYPGEESSNWEIF